MEKYLESIYKDMDKDFEREKEEKEMFRDSIRYYYYYQENGVKYKPEPVDELGASPLHVAASKGKFSLFQGYFQGRVFSRVFSRHSLYLNFDLYGRSGLS